MDKDGKVFWCVAVREMANRYFPSGCGRTETPYKNMGRKRSPSREVWIKASSGVCRDSGQPPEEERD